MSKKIIERVIPGKKIAFTNLDEAIRYARSMENKERNHEKPVPGRTGPDPGGRMVTLSGKNGEHITLSVSQLEDALVRAKEQIADRSEICFTKLSGSREVAAVKEPVHGKKGLPQDKGKSASGKAALRKMRVRAVRRPAGQLNKQEMSPVRTHLKACMAGKSRKPPIDIYVRDTAGSAEGRHSGEKNRTDANEKKKAEAERATKRHPVVYMSGKHKAQRGKETLTIVPVQHERVPKQEPAAPDGQNNGRKIRGAHIGADMLRNSQTIKIQEQRGREGASQHKAHSPVKEKSPGEKPVRRHLDELEVMGNRMVQARKIMIKAATITLSSGRMTSFTDKYGKKLTFRREMEDNSQTGQKEPIVRGYIDGKAVRAKAFEEGNEVDDRQATRFLSDMLKDMSKESVRELQTAVETAEQNPSIRREDLQLETEEEARQEEKDRFKGK